MRPRSWGEVSAPSSERALTVDGVLLGMRRYPRPGAPPVLLLHGLAQNLYGWDLPVPGHSLARYLAAAEFDVWLGNFRGHGRAPDRSGTGPRAATIDDYGLRDVPALVERVRRTTGRPPLVVAHSMGGIATLMYLTGADFDEHGRVTHCPRRASERNEAVAGAALVAVPAGLRWTVRPGVRTFLGGRAFECNPLFQTVVARRAVRSLLDALPVEVLPIGRAARVAHRAAALPRPLGLVGGAAVTLAGAATSRALAHSLWNPANMTRALVDAEARYTLEDASRLVLRQFCDWIAHGTMREHVADDDGRPPFVYAEHLRAVRVPALLVAGDRDTIVPPTAVREFGLRALGSRDRGVLVVRGFGHNDLRVGRAAPTALYPRLAEWLLDRARRGRVVVTGPLLRSRADDAG